MRTLKLATIGCAVLVAAGSAQRTGAVLFDGARLITGDGRGPIENGALLVQDGRISAIGTSSEVKAPRGASRIDLTGKTVMPTLNNVHIHIGYEGFTTWSVNNNTPQNIVDHLQREAFYGVGVVMTAGDQPPDRAIQFQKDQRAGRFPPAARLFFSAGMAPPGGGPDALLIQGTTPLKAVYEVTSGQEARAAVRQIASLKIEHIKIWVDDRDAKRGSMKKMSPEVYQAIVDEAHKHGMLVHAHATSLADQKAVVKAGVDVVVHTVAGEKIDDEYVAIVKEKKPYYAPVMGLGDPPEVCEPNNQFVEQSLPEQAIADIREGRNAFKMPGCAGYPNPNMEKRESILKYNVPKMIEAGARLVLATDAGVLPKYSFGWSEHHEMAMYVRLGLPPAQVVVAATSRPVELLRIKDTGALATGKRADLLVLDANPLEDIRNTRRINSVYLNGVRLDRAKLLAGFKTRR